MKEEEEEGVEWYECRCLRIAVQSWVGEGG